MCFIGVCFMILKDKASYRSIIIIVEIQYFQDSQCHFPLRANIGFPT